MADWRRWLRTFQPKDPEQTLQEVLNQVGDQLPTPCLALVGEPQVGKSSVVRLLTGDPNARIGDGDGIPVTEHFEEYRFPPNTDVPLWVFLDMPGLGAQNLALDQQELQDLLDGKAQAPDSPGAEHVPSPHAFLVCVRVDDEELGIIPWLQHLAKKLPGGGASVPFLVVQTCFHRLLHPHPMPYPFGVRGDEIPESLPTHVTQTLEKQRQAIRQAIPHADFVVVDITDPEDEVGDPHYGGPALIEALFHKLPDTIASTLRSQRDAFQAAFSKEADKIIWGYSVAAGSAGALPPPVGDMGTLAIVTSMLQQLAALYRQEWDWRTFLELLGSLGGGTLLWLLVRYLGRRLPIPVLMAPIGAAGAFSLTWSLGHLMSWYYAQVHEGHIPNANDLKAHWKNLEQESMERWKDVAHSLLRKDKSSDHKRNPA
ncbi:MAG: DUF697 domain-containing protein [Deltaproteobacteria bacterium]|nr:MAG: DUF697 domain-containing protein [Deltaproteobacteria bacterium]